MSGYYAVWRFSNRVPGHRLLGKNDAIEEKSSPIIATDAESFEENSLPIKTRLVFPETWIWGHFTAKYVLSIWISCVKRILVKFSDTFQIPVEHSHWFDFSYSVVLLSFFIFIFCRVINTACRQDLSSYFKVDLRVSFWQSSFSENRQPEQFCCFLHVSNLLKLARKLMFRASECIFS